MVKGGHSHRATMKKDHKPFKSKHASKGQLKNQHKGKVEKTTGGGKQIKVVSKLDRKNQAKQLKDNKVLESKLARKLFEGSNGAERIVTVISLTKDMSPVDMVNQLLQPVLDSDQDTIQFEYPSVNNFKVQKFRSNLKVIIPDADNLLAIMDAAKVSDFVLLGLSAVTEVESNYGEQIIRTLLAQGVATIHGVLPNLVSSYPKRNLQLDVRQSLLSYFSFFFPSEDKLYALEIESEATNCIRNICQKFPKSVNWRDSRAYVIADSVERDQNGIVIEGTVRGIGFNADNLVHIPGYGDFQIESMEKVNRGFKGDADMGDLILPTEAQETLEEFNPEEAEMDEDWEGFQDDDALGVRMDGKEYFHDSTNGAAAPRKFKVPKGTSEYQAKWLLDDILEDVSEDEFSDDEPVSNDQEMDDDDMQDFGGDANDFDENVTENGESEMFVELNDEDEQRQLQEFRAIAKDDLEFPDEIELHPSQSAKEALKKYRGIKSLGNCDWDYDEFDDEAPEAWTKILRVSNYKSTRNKVAKDAIKKAQVNISSRIRLSIRAPQEIADNSDPSKKPFVVYSLLDHEHKQALVNFSFQNWEDYEEPIESREKLIVQYGFRREVIQPIFNQGSNNPNNVHKFERFYHPHNTSIATCIAPVMFYNAPAVFFKQNEDGSLQLVGQGTFLNTDHTRIVAERAVLTGHPVKIHKRLVTVRYMFFNLEDINWFKAIPLFTKSGRTGFIKESLGTHGYFKATFDGKLTSQDVVAMSMYKRVWPERSVMFNQ